MIRDERREQLLEHATMLFAKNGYGPTKIGDVAKSANLRAGAV
jgi:AcrR family transcriptional regulator